MSNEIGNMLPFHLLKRIETDLMEVFGQHYTHKDLQTFLAKCNIPNDILSVYYRPKPKAPPGYYYFGASKKTIIEGILREIEKRGDLGTLLRVLDEVISDKEALAPTKAQGVLGDLEQIRKSIATREVGVTSPEKDEGAKKCAEVGEEQPATLTIRDLRAEFDELRKETDHQKRGYKFEAFLYRLFDWAGLKPLYPFRVTGEQIDGGLEFKGSVYLLEARWRKESANSQDLMGLSGKAQRRIEGTKGIFISLGGYSPDAVTSYSIGSRPNIILLDGGHLMAVLEERITLPSLLEEIWRRASSTGEVYSSIGSIVVL